MTPRPRPPETPQSCPEKHRSCRRLLAMDHKKLGPPRGPKSWPSSIFDFQPINYSIHGQIGERHAQKGAKKIESDSLKHRLQERERTPYLSAAVEGWAARCQSRNIFHITSLNWDGLSPTIQAVAWAFDTCCQWSERQCWIASDHSAEVQVRCELL